MTRRHPHPPDGIGHESPASNGSIAGGVAVLVLLIAGLVAASYPTAALTVAAALAGVVLALRTGVPAIGRRLHGRVTELEVPGLGTVRIQVTAR